MRDAIGGVMTIQIIIVFMLLVNGYLAFSVNYTKAFRVKNEILSLIEQHEGHTEDAATKIDSYLNQTHYSAPSSAMIALESSTSDPGYCCFRGKGYCVKKTATDTEGNTIDDPDGIKGTYRGTYYSVVTFINIDIPIINKILPNMPFMRVKGETKIIYSSGNNSELQCEGKG